MHTDFPLIRYKPHRNDTCNNSCLCIHCRRKVFHFFRIWKVGYTFESIPSVILSSPLLLALPLITDILLRAHSNTYLLTELSPSWGAANCAATQELPSTSWYPKVQDRVHKSPPLVPILSHVNPIHTIPSYLTKIHFNIVHPPTGVRGSVVGWGTMLQAGRSPVRVPDEVDFFDLPNLSSL
jgi:hypothetical protein